MPRILPASPVPQFSLGWGRWLLWVGGCSCWQETAARGVQLRQSSLAAHTESGAGMGSFCRETSKEKKKPKKMLFTRFRHAHLHA